MRLYQLTDEFKEGKYLVVRRDGTIPEWPHFVLSARDPAAPEALRSYALRCAKFNLDRDYVDSVWDLSRMFEDYHQAHGAGDPEAPPHRQDNSYVISMMRHETDLTGLGQAPRMRDDIEYIGALNKIVRLAASYSGDEGSLSLDKMTVLEILQTAQDVLRAHIAEGTDTSGPTARTT